MRPMTTEYRPVWTSGCAISLVTPSHSSRDTLHVHQIKAPDERGVIRNNIIYFARRHLVPRARMRSEGDRTDAQFVAERDQRANGLKRFFEPITSVYHWIVVQTCAVF